jgi:hypothetical protein
MIKISFRNHAFVDMTGNLHRPADNPTSAGPFPDIYLICLIKDRLFGCRTIGKILSDVNAFYQFAQGRYPHHRFLKQGPLFFFTKFGYIFTREKSSSSRGVRHVPRPYSRYDSHSGNEKTSGGLHPAVIQI